MLFHSRVKTKDDDDSGGNSEKGKNEKEGQKKINSATSHNESIKSFSVSKLETHRVKIDNKGSHI